MAGVTDLAFRTLCREQGAGLTYTEMISSKALCFHDKKTGELLLTGENEHPVSVQIFGSDPESMGRAAEIALSVSKADILDINMGCPTPKIVKNGDGCALMKDMALASRIIESVAKSVQAPVTVKFRLGWDENSVNALEFARMAQESGASGLCLHARTCRQMYAGKADWELISRVKQAVRIPVIANGDIKDARSAADILIQTGADMAMIGRASLGNPWIFAHAEALLDGLPEPPAVTCAQRCDMAVRQFALMAQYKGERISALEMRKHFSWYLRGVKNASRFKEQCSGISCAEDVYALSREVRDAFPDNPNDFPKAVNPDG
jgi:tRNA-dihydrouridine synthase B